MFVAAERDYSEIVQLLTAAGADGNKARTADGATPLYMAAYKGHVMTVRLLIEAGADMDQAENHTGATPLCTWCRQKQS